MPDFVHALLDWWDRRYWLVRATWAQLSGRWYVLREAPDHVVAFYAMIADMDEKDEHFAAFGREAARERDLRRQRGEWDSELDSEFKLDPSD